MNSEEQAIYAVDLAWLAECSDEELEALRLAKVGKTIDNVAIVAATPLSGSINEQTALLVAKWESSLQKILTREQLLTAFKG